MKSDSKLINWLEKEKLKDQVEINSKKNELINSIKKHNKEKKRVKQVIEFVKNNNGLNYAEQKMVQFQQEALQLIENYPQSDYKNSLIMMVNYVIDRKK